MKSLEDWEVYRRNTLKQRIALKQRFVERGIQNDLYGDLNELEMNRQSFANSPSKATVYDDMAVMWPD